MARSKDENKRQAILRESKRLFAEHGFADTAVSDIVRETGLPVGSIYTYFQSKHEIIHSIVEEGWTEFYADLSRLVESELEPLVKLRKLITEFLPRLLEDVDFVHILLGETAAVTGVDEKIDAITDVVVRLLRGLPASSRFMRGVSRAYLRTSVVIYSLGMMHAVRFTRESTAGMSVAEIVQFTRDTLSRWIGAHV